MPSIKGVKGNKPENPIHAPFAGNVRPYGGVSDTGQASVPKGMRPGAGQSVGRKGKPKSGSTGARQFIDK